MKELFFETLRLIFFVFIIMLVVKAVDLTIGRPPIKYKIFIENHDGGYKCEGYEVKK